MIGIILVVLFLVLMVVWFYDSTGGSLILILLILPLSMVLVSGVFTYPTLVSMRETALSLKEEIETVKNSYYQNVSSGTLVGGSLDNIQQSKELSEYVKQYAAKKAEYNSSLISAKTRLSLPIFWWVGDTIFMNKEILKLQRID